MPVVRIERTHPCRYQILSLTRLPIPPYRPAESLIDKLPSRLKSKSETGLCQLSSEDRCNKQAYLKFRLEIYSRKQSKTQVKDREIGPSLVLPLKVSRWRQKKERSFDLSFELNFK